MTTLRQIVEEAIGENLGLNDGACTWDPQAYIDENSEGDWLDRKAILNGKRILFLDDQGYTQHAELCFENGHWEGKRWIRHDYYVHDLLEPKGYVGVEMLMNPLTGSVQSSYAWAEESCDWDGNLDEQFSSLVEVEKDSQGDWKEKK